MADVVFFAGPIILRPTFSQIDWLGRDVRIVPIVGAGSSTFAALAETLRDGDGRILPNMVKKYVKGVDSIDKIAVCCYSAGHGLLNKIGQVPADLERLSAAVLSDGSYIGSAGLPKGLTNYCAAGIAGKMLSIATTSHAGGEGYLAGHLSYAQIWEAAGKSFPSISREIAPRDPAPEGMWFKRGMSALWGDLPQLTHAQVHDTAPFVWQAYLAPYLARNEAFDDMFAAAGVKAFKLLRYRV